MKETQLNNESIYAETKSTFAMWKILLPVAIGLVVVILMFIHDSKDVNISELWKSINFDSRSVSCLIFAVIFMLGRDLGISWRYRILTNNEISWKNAFLVDFLCQFTSCITPTPVGGSAMGGIFLNTKGIEFGRATTLMFTTLFLDQIFYVVIGPIIVLVTPAKELFHSGSEAFNQGLQITFWIVYSLLCCWALILFTGIIWKPSWVKIVLLKITKLKLLKRWRSKAIETADNMLATSRELKNKPFRFWIKSFFVTVFLWTSKYLVINCLFFGFVPSADSAQWLIFAREFVMWVSLNISPTPGGSGLSEWMFSEYYGDLVPIVGIALILAIFWRVITYYFYLIIGLIILPGWLKNSLKSKKLKRNEKSLDCNTCEI